MSDTSYGVAKKNSHPVLFVGAGPGDPELITIRGKRALEEADLVIYAGSLVPEAMLAWTKPTAMKLSSAGMHLEQIIDEMASGYHQGKRVVRLHTGDPSLYGAIFEQMVALDSQSIPYGIIPGVTAAFAAAATLGLEFTIPEVSQTLILTRMAGRTPVPEKESLASLAAHQATMAIYLSISMVDQVAEVLANCYGPDNPCAVVYRASQPDERVIITPICHLAEKVASEKITRQALIIVGKVLAMKPDAAQLKSKLYDKHFSHGFRSAVSDE